MTDLEMTKLCAEACGWHTGGKASKAVAYPVNECAIIAGNDKGGESVYDPLHDDAQAMALVKKFGVDCLLDDQGNWLAGIHTPCEFAAANTDLNRAIVECCALMQLAKEK